MANVIDALKAVNAYPIPMQTLENIAVARGLDAESEITPELLRGKAFHLAKADVFSWLSIAPNVSQGGQNYSFTDEQRKQLKKQAEGLYELSGFEVEKVEYGYKGSRL